MHLPAPSLPPSCTNRNRNVSSSKTPKGESRNDLLQSIRDGKSLRKVDKSVINDRSSTTNKDGGRNVVPKSVADIKKLPAIGGLFSKDNLTQHVSGSPNTNTIIGTRLKKIDHEDNLSESVEDGKNTLRAEEYKLNPDDGYLYKSNLKKSNNSNNILTNLKKTPLVDNLRSSSGQVKVGLKRPTQKPPPPPKNSNNAISNVLNTKTQNGSTTNICGLRVDGGCRMKKSETVMRRPQVMPPPLPSPGVVTVERQQQPTKRRSKQYQDDESMLSHMITAPLSTNNCISSFEMRFINLFKGETLLPLPEAISISKGKSCKTYPSVMSSSAPSRANVTTISR